MRIAIDFDDTIFDRENNDLMPGAREAINKLAEDNHILIFTTRPDYEYPTIKTMMDMWGIRYDRIQCGKPAYDLLIDDKAKEFRSWNELREV